ncbi:hypothetical protein BKA15_000930 [Microlunatus parietis]|uniref:Uncharacterized protein n=1 Tax=Microlunatus parietis TaxID=682979 RepID=A0A7Y9LBA1_9ACTN|nr:hypothetical protein [Microlunatus parietis]
MNPEDPVTGPLPDRFEARTMIETELTQQPRFDHRVPNPH